LNTKIAELKMATGRETKTKVTMAAEEDMETDQENTRYFEGRGGQNIQAYHMTVKGVERQDASDMLKVIYEILRRMRQYDSSLTVFTENKDGLDIERLREGGQDELDWAFEYDKELNQKSGKYKFTVHIHFMARQTIKNLKERGVGIPYLKTQKIQIKKGSQFKITQERCGWISLVAKYTICDVLYCREIMQTIAHNLTSEEIAQIKEIIEANTEEETDEYTEFSPDKLSGFLDLEWNTITFGPSTNLSQCHAMEFTCPKFLVQTFENILARIFQNGRNFPNNQGELRPARLGSMVDPTAAVVLIKEQQDFMAEWTGLEVYHLSRPERQYRDTLQTIQDYILHKTGGIRILPTIDTEEKGKYIIMLKKGKAKKNFHLARDWYNFEM
jgi:hypothetical protein